MQLALGVILVATVAVGVLHRDEFKRYMALVLTRVFILLASLGYVSLSFSALSLFDCTKLDDGRYYLDADLGACAASVVVAAVVWWRQWCGNGVLLVLCCECGGGIGVVAVWWCCGSVGGA